MNTVKNIQSKKRRLLNSLVLSFSISIFSTSCSMLGVSSSNNDDDFTNAILAIAIVNATQSTGYTPDGQYTPNQADWSTFSNKPFEGGTNTAHDPDGVGWITKASWDAAKWDGTVYNPNNMTNDNFYKAICPTVDQIRGIREVFYANSPFADNRNPTKAEVDEWHRIAINHLRALVGYTEEERKVQKDHCMFARALWGQERRFTTKWDSKYPGTVGTAYGPCQGSSNAHCGATFVPDAADQAPYLPEGHATCGTPQGAEGVSGNAKSNIPWSIKWSRVICNYIREEGITGHSGPFFLREKFGFSFWDNETGNNNSASTLRGKWTGKLLNHK